MNDPKTRREYSTDEVGAIVRLALERQGPEGRISHDELLETAREIGVSAEDIEEAVAEEARIRQAKAEIFLRRRRLKQQFFANLVSFVAVNGALFVIDRVTTGGTWFYWPLLVWGIALTAHAAVLLSPRTEDETAKLEATRGKSRARIDAAFGAAALPPVHGPKMGRPALAGEDGEPEGEARVGARRQPED